MLSSYRRILVRGLFVLCLLALAGTHGVSAQSLPPCIMNIPDDDGDGVNRSMDIDKDNDGLIEICDLEGLDEMRHQSDGSGYRTSADAMKITDGCPSNSCTGFELTRNLDFNDAASYRSGSTTQAWTSGRGWQPIGGDPLEDDVSFSATFNGNGYTISNLMIDRSDTPYIGLFGYTEASTVDINIANLGLLDVNIMGFDSVGGLVGQNDAAIIINSYVTGEVRGSDESVGGLVGFNSGSIANSHAAVSVSGGTGIEDDNKGGLVGLNSNGTIMNSYATGIVSGPGNRRGGLVGASMGVATIENSYATGGVIAGSDSDVGGLVGWNTVNSMVDNSYWLRGSASSGGTGVAMNTSKTMMELQSPTTNEGIYANWSTDDWSFGSSTQYPALKYAKGTDTDYQACSDTPPQTGSDQPQCGTLLLNKRMSAGIQIRVFLEGLFH